MLGLLRVARVIDACNSFIGRAMGWIALLMVAIGVANVVGRYLGAYLSMQLSSNSLLEAQTYAYSLVFFLGAAHVLRSEGHIRVDILYIRFSARTRAWVDLIGTAVLLIPFCVFALYFSVDYVAHSWKVMEMSPNPGGLPRYPLKTVILVAFTMLLLQAVSEMIKRAAWLRGVPGPGEGDERRVSAEEEQG